LHPGLQAISAGSDGTIRAWDLRNSQCLTVLENSDDKVWALDATPDGSFVVTGSADSILTIWKDITDQKVQESHSRKKALLETEQKLQNVINSGKWANAIELAIKLKRPFALLRVVRSKFTLVLKLTFSLPAIDLTPHFFFPQVFRKRMPTYYPR